MPENTAQSCEFRAEVRKVLSILTNSLYTNREIFLRELISNASDALDKLRFRSNRGETPRHDDLPLEIRISLDKDAKTLTVEDTGLGMTAAELAETADCLSYTLSDGTMTWTDAQGELSSQLTEEEQELLRVPLTWTKRAEESK